MVLISEIFLIVNIKIVTINMIVESISILICIV